MPVALARIDDRLIHGQVTVGWGTQLQPDLILLANNAVAADPWQSRVYASSVPPEIRRRHPLGARRGRAGGRRGGDGRAHPAADGLAGGDGRAGAPGRADRRGSIVGGLHYSAGKQEMLPFVYVDRQDLRALHRLLELGVTLAAQQVPGGRAHPLGAAQLAAMEARV